LPLNPPQQLSLLDYGLLSLVLLLPGVAMLLHSRRQCYCWTIASNAFRVGA